MGATIIYKLYMMFYDPFTTFYILCQSAAPPDDRRRGDAKEKGKVKDQNLEIGWCPAFKGQNYSSSHQGKYRPSRFGH